jgi:hypothetical protein
MVGFNVLINSKWRVKGGLITVPLSIYYGEAVEPQQSHSTAANPIQTGYWSAEQTDQDVSDSTVAATFI